MRIRAPKLIHKLFVVVLIIGLITSTALVRAPKTQADRISNRSVTLSNYTASAIATHNYKFDNPSTSSIGSIAFEYCDNTSLFNISCSAPAGLNVTAAGLVSQTGNTGFIIDNGNTTANRLVISRPASAANLTTSTYSFTNITNPSSSGTTVYVRISLYASSDGTGTVIDNGAVAFVTNAQFTVGAFVPPYLRMCVAVTVSADCSSMSGDSIDIGDLASNHANSGQTQFAAGTNSPSGYSIYSLGTTMTSGNNSISLLTSPTGSVPNQPQFGINLRANLNPAVGQDPVGLGLAVPTASYNIPNRFLFIDGDNIANATQPSDYNRMTVSYLVNRPTNQPIGVYSTTISFLILATF